MNCLIVEDDSDIAGIIRNGLSEIFGSIDVIDNAQMAITKILSSEYDLVITDLLLPGINGFEVIDHLKKCHQTPIIVVSGRGDCSTREVALKKGAEDFILKPFSLAELQIKVQRILSQQSNKQLILTSGEMVLNRLTRKVTVKGKNIELQEKEFQLLELLIESPSKIITKTVILKEIWNYDFDPQTNIVDVMVCRLRQKIDSDDNKTIRTVRGIGYTVYRH